MRTKNKPSLGATAPGEAILRQKAEVKKIRQRRQPERHPVAPLLREQIFRRDAYQCRQCGSAPRNGINLELDHIVPISRGGTNDPHNLQTLCRPCNQAKSNHLTQQF